MTGDDLRTYGTLYAAVVGTAGLLWTFVRDRKDRASIKFDGFCGTVHRPTRRGLREDKAHGPILKFTATNTGRRPIILVHFGGFTKDKDRQLAIMHDALTLPRRLEEGEQIHFMLPVQLINDDVEGLFLTDSTDRKWKMKPKAFMTLKRDALARCSEIEAARADAEEPSKKVG